MTKNPKKIKLKPSSKKIYIATLLLLVAIVGFMAWFFNFRETPESVLEKYLIKTAQLNEFSSVDTTSGTGSSSTLKGKLNIKDKNLIIAGDYQCSSKSDFGEVKINASIQQEGAFALFKINSIEGNILDENGQESDLREEFANATGNWYKFEDEDKATRALLDKKVFLLSSLVMAPENDAQNIANVLLGQKAIILESGKKVGDDYVLNIKINKSAYEDAVNELFPDLDSKDLIIDTIFSDDSEISTEITVSPDGTYKSERSEVENECYFLMQSFIGVEPLDLAKRIKVESKAQNVDGLEPIKDYKSFTDFINDTSPLE